jgi:hypothetical protein
MPDAEGVRGSTQQGEIGEHRADNRIDQTHTGPQALLHLRADGLFVGLDLGYRDVSRVLRTQRNNAVAIAWREQTPLSSRSLVPHPGLVQHTGLNCAVTSANSSRHRR